jgi:hypothetical protein
MRHIFWQNKFGCLVLIAQSRQKNLFDVVGYPLGVGAGNDNYFHN